LILLEKEPSPGTFISPEIIEEVTGIDRNHADYSLAVLDLREQLENKIEEKFKIRIMTRMHKKGIRFLSTKETVSHGKTSMEATRKRHRWWYLRTRRFVQPNIGDLSDNEKKHYNDMMDYHNELLLKCEEVENYWTTPNMKKTRIIPEFNDDEQKLPKDNEENDGEEETAPVPVK